MFNVARIKPAPAIGRGLFESGGSRIRDVPDACALSQDALAEAVEPYRPESIVPATSLRRSIATGSSSLL
jgi:hypothetical protein